MRRIEVDGFDKRRIRSQIGQCVAAAGGDRHHPLSGRQLHGRHVDFWIFPDLGINQPGESMREQAFGQPGA
ncbi:MAG: hypothetical protein K0S21_163 [Rhizobiaceae bacterium]|nr:hypothetical protein [Rhizobiaceae bacterium]